MTHKKNNQSTEEINKEFIKKWELFSLYLKNEIEEGKWEFRISFQDNKKFIIHPINKNGETLDLDI